MPDHRDRRWLSWRIAPAPRPSARPAPALTGRLAGYDLALQNATVTDTPQPDPLADLKAERPGPDGIRAGLVARVRQLIAEGKYDTPDRWAEAEEWLFRRVADGR